MSARAATLLGMILIGCVQPALAGDKDEQVTFANAKAGVKLAGTLTLPKGEGPFRAVLLLSDRGPHDRDAAAHGHKPFLVLAEYLAKRGIAVLRTDDRGVGKSTGKFAGATLEDFAQDAGAGIAWLRERKDIDGKKIGVVGHGEGGMTAALVAAQDRDLAFLALLASPATPGQEYLRYQGEAVLRASKNPAALGAWYPRTYSRILETIKVMPANTNFKKEIRAILAQGLPGLEKEDLRIAEELEKTFAAEKLPAVRFLVRHDPRTALAGVRCPVLAVYGDKDQEIALKRNVSEMTTALKGNKDASVRELKGMNHLFQNCKTGRADEYRQIEETLAPALLEVVGNWIGERVK